MTHNRRKFIQGIGLGFLGAAFNPFQILIKNAMAQEFAEFNKNYISFYMDGAPPRWMFDLILKTAVTKDINGNRIAGYTQNFLHPMVFTEINADPNNLPNFAVTHNDLTPAGGPTGHYRTLLRNGLYLPPIWSSFDDLLENWLTIRGIDTIPFHGAAKVRTHNFGASQYSLQSFAGERETNINFGPIQNNLEANFLHVARKEIATTKIKVSGSENVISILMKAFVGKKLSSQRKLLMDAYQESIIRGLRGSTKTSGKAGLNSQYNSTLSSKRIFNQNIEQIIDEYPDAFNRYRGIVINSLNNSIETSPIETGQGNSSDPSIVTSINNIDNIQIYSSWTDFCLQNINNYELRTWYENAEVEVKTNALDFNPNLNGLDMYIINKNGEIESSNSIDRDHYTNSAIIPLRDGEPADNDFSVTDMRINLVNTDEYNKLVSSFALSEVLIKNNLSNNLITDIGGGSVGNDGHSVGSIAHLYSYTKYYHALLSSMKELKTSIGSSKFDKSLFQISSEFNRIPRITEGGSDHASTNIFSFFGGLITNGPHFGGKARVGNALGDYGENIGENYGIPAEQKSDYLALYDSVAYIFGTRASRNPIEKMAFRKINGVWSFKDELVNILIDEDLG